MPDITRLQSYWTRVPPLRDIIAHFLGVQDAPPVTGEMPSLIDLPEFEA